MRCTLNNKAKQYAPWAGNAVIVFPVRAGAHDKSV